MRILGIDPGFGRLGIGVVDVDQGKETCVYSECFETNPKDSFHSRLKTVGDKIQLICKEWCPDSASVETLFFEKNQKKLYFFLQQQKLLLNLQPHLKGTFFKIKKISRSSSAGRATDL